MDRMKRVVLKLSQELQNFYLVLSTLFTETKERVENDVPYVSQFAHPEYAKKILKDGVQKTSDPNWRNTGAVSPEEYARWVLVMCGMACTSMVLKYFKSRNDGIVTLAKDAMKHGVYKQDGNELSSMHYKEFSEWIKGYDLGAGIYTRLTVCGLQKLLSGDKLVIVSVNPNIRGYETVGTTQEGGHLVLVTGYDKAKNTLTIHNPSGFVSEGTQENHKVPIPEFLRYYARRGISVSV